MIFRRIERLLASAFTAALLIPNCLWAQAPAAPPGAAPPATTRTSKGFLSEVISTYGQGTDDLFFVISWITGITLVVVFSLFFYFAIRYRYQEGRRARYVHGNTKLEWIWTAGTSAILIWLVFTQREAWDDIKLKDYSTLENPYLVRVFGEQFAWHFVYPGADGEFETSDLKNVFQGTNPVGLKNPRNDVYSSALVVPENVPVILELNALGKYDQDNQRVTALPVLHSFFQPNLRMKQDLVPFHPGKMWFQILPGKLGKFEIACAELCGLGHYTMRADMEVLSDQDLATRLGYDWKAKQAKFND